jgi:site-specific DNA-methyltransferase (adenine-specific)
MGNQAKAELKRGNLDFTGDPRSPLNSFNTVQQVKNNHPTVKPTTLMSYLIRLVTPKGGTVLDPFNGSGSTGKACMYENKDRNAGYKYIGIELTPEYLPISDARIRYAIGDTTPVEYKTPTKPKPVGQFSLFDFGE